MPGWDPGAVEAPYAPRFIPRTPEASAELVNLYHLALTALYPERGRHARMRWASGQYHIAHPAVTALGAYKDLEGLLA